MSALSVVSVPHHDQSSSYDRVRHIMSSFRVCFTPTDRPSKLDSSLITMLRAHPTETPSEAISLLWLDQGLGLLTFKA